MVLDVVDQLESGSEKPVPQDPAAATFTSILSKDDGRIDWSSSAEHIERMVRAYSPWPLAHTSLSGLRLNILHAAVPPDNIQELVSGRDSVPGTVAGVDKSAGILIQTGNGLLSVQKLQLQNKKPLDWKSFLNGVRSFPGTLLGG
jgi:methionyl-tRNA formyltransferase